MEILTNKYKEQEKNQIESIKNSSKKKRNPDLIIEEIKNSFKNDCPIITTSINMGDSGHEYSILGTYSETNPNDPDKLQEFIILKNPWRSGSLDPEKEKINESEINAIVNSY